MRINTELFITPSLNNAINNTIPIINNPNLTLDNIYALDNTFTGLNNVIESGLSDIYYDIVTCEKSIEKYYGKEYVSVFYQKLGIEKDDNKSSYYSILNELKK